MPFTEASPGTRRRVVTGSDNKTATQVNGDGKTASTSPNGRDLINKAVLERSSREAKRGGDGNPPRKTRKPISKTENPLYFTVWKIFQNLFVPLVVIFWLIQWFCGYSGHSVDGGLAGLSEFEGRISDVEGLLKKIDNDVIGLRKEVSEKVDELKNLETKGEKLERYLSELKVEDWLSKQEFENFVEEFRRVKGNGNVYEGDGLDEIREFAKDVIEKEIEKHAADGLGRVDYALGSAGARVVKHSKPAVDPSDVWWGNWFFLSAIPHVEPDADKMLKPSFGEPGQCFSLKGSSGFVQIRLLTEIIPEAVTLEHVAKSVAYDRSSAPKDCKISGWLHKDVSSVIDMEKMFLLGEFTYDLEKSNAQTFNVLNSARSIVIDTVRLDFTSNHGSDMYTCIYRLRVHGHVPESVSMMPMES